MVTNTSSFTNFQYDLVKRISIDNFLLYYIFSFILLINYVFLTSNFTNVSVGLIAMAWVVFLTIFVIKLYSDIHYFKYPKVYILYSSLLSFIFLYIISLDTYLFGNLNSYTYNNDIGWIGFWYVFVAFLITIYYYRKNIISFLSRFRYVPQKLIYSPVSILKFIFKLTLIPDIYEWYSLRKLNNDTKSVYFAKKFIILQLKPIKSVLPGLSPGTVTGAIQDIFKNDVERMNHLFIYNHIKTHSTKVTLKFVMHVANPIIQDLKLTLEQYYTEELLKEGNGPNNLTVNVDILFKRAEKIITNWESTFSDSDMAFKDNLLIK